MSFAQVLVVTTVDVGSAVVGDHAAGVQTLAVEQVADFAGGAGSVSTPVGVLGYTLVDSEAATLQLSAPLADALADGDPVYAWNGVRGEPVRETLAQVRMEGTSGDEEGTPLTATVPQALIPYLPEGIRTAGAGEAVEVEVRGGELTVVDIPGVSPRFDGSYLDATTIPDPVPVVPPAVSPALTVTGIANGLVVRTEQVAPTTLVEYHVSATTGFSPSPATLSGSATRSGVVVVTSLPDGTPMVEGTAYYLRSVATNAAGAAPPSPEASGTPDTSVVSRVVAAEIVTGFLLTGRIEIGSAYIDADEGLVAPQPDGGRLVVPFDGSRAQFDGGVLARSLTVAGSASVYGAMEVLGSLVAKSGVSRPQTPPGVAPWWSALVTDLSGTGYGGVSRGLTTNPAGSLWVVGEAFFGGAVRTVDVSTGASTKYGLGTFNVAGGVTRIGSTYYALGYDTARGNRWFVYILDATFTKTGEWEYPYQSDSAYDPAIGTDGTYVVIARPRAGDSKPVWRRLTPATGAVAVAAAVGDTAMAAHLRGLYLGSADFGATRLVLATDTTIRAFDPGTGVRASSSEWPRAANANLRGLYYDGTVFHSLDDTGLIYHYTARSAAETVTASFSWYDGDATGGTHETQETTTPATYTWPARAGLQITVPPAPDAGVVDPLRVDKADSARVYASTSGARQLQGTLAPGTNTLFRSTLATGGGAPPTSNGFAGLPGGVGQFISEAADATGPLVKIAGDGSWRLPTLAAGHGANAPWRAGVVNTGTMVTGTVKVVAVTFATPFPAGTTYQVALTVNVANPQDMLASVEVGSKTATGFNLRVNRAAGTSAQDIDYIAVPV